MNCKKVRCFLPLFVGSELSQSKVKAIQFHLKNCSKCQKEYDSYVLSIKKTREWLILDSPVWEDREWLKAVQEAQKKEISPASPFVPRLLKRAWVYALIAVFAAALTFFVTSPSLIREEITPKPGMLAEPQQDIISLTMVSKETGLKITWFFNKNFEFKEDK